MKIGILTFHRPINYGAVLQAYAMTQIFSEFGEAQIIDYHPKSERDLYSLFDGRFLAKNISLKSRANLFKITLKKLLLLPMRFRKQLKYRSFVNHYIPLSEPYLVEQTMPVYDAYIYGSDQIWRSHGRNSKGEPLTDFIYFGANVPNNKKKIAYAASCGNVSKGFFNTQVVMKFLNDFEQIGARELYLTSELRQCLDTKITDVLDPTMLLSREKWSSIASTIGVQEKQPYLLIYNLAPSESALKIAKNIAKKQGLKLVQLNGYDSFSSAFFNNGSIDTAGPIEFLNLILNATFVVSSSYHGVIFSILFGKQFYASGMTGRSDRVESLLSKLNLSNRLIEDELNVNLANVIDYEILNHKLGNLIEESKKFIYESMN